MTSHKLEATSAKSIPSGSTWNAIARPGITANSVTAGRPPANTSGANNATTSTKDPAESNVHISRRFGRWPNNAASTVAITGRASAT